MEALAVEVRREDGGYYKVSFIESLHKYFFRHHSHELNIKTMGCGFSVSSLRPASFWFTEVAQLRFITCGRHRPIFYG